MKLEELSCLGKTNREYGQILCEKVSHKYPLVLLLVRPLSIDEQKLLPYVSSPATVNIKKSVQAKPEVVYSKLRVTNGYKTSQQPTYVWKNGKAEKMAATEALKHSIFPSKDNDVCSWKVCKGIYLSRDKFGDTLFRMWLRESQHNYQHQRNMSLKLGLECQI